MVLGIARPEVNHTVSGADVGWRWGAGKWSEYFVDSVGTVVDIGRGSPTGVAFGFGAKFPAKYQNALVRGGLDLRPHVRRAPHSGRCDLHG